MLFIHRRKFKSSQHLRARKPPAPYVIWLVSRRGLKRSCSTRCLCLPFSLHWRHNDHDGVSNHQPHGCLLNLLFGRRSKKTSKLRVTGLCVGNSPGSMNSPHKGPVTRKMFRFDDVIMSQTYDRVSHRTVVCHWNKSMINVFSFIRNETKKLVLNLVRDTFWSIPEMSGLLPSLHWRESRDYLDINGTTAMNKQRVLMHRHQGWNVRHGLCHIYMRYLYIYELLIAFVCFVVCSLL